MNIVVESYAAYCIAGALNSAQFVQRQSCTVHISAAGEFQVTTAESEHDISSITRVYTWVAHLATEISAAQGIVPPFVWILGLVDFHGYGTGSWEGFRSIEDCTTNSWSPSAGGSIQTFSTSCSRLTVPKVVHPPFSPTCAGGPKRGLSSF